MNPVIQMKNLLHYCHKPDSHNVSMRLDRVVHDPRFWAILAIIAMVCLFILMATMIGAQESGNIHVPSYNFPYPHMLR